MNAAHARRPRTEDARKPASRVGAALAAIAGCVDTLCFIALFNVFTAHVTGNIATLFAGFAQPHSQWWLKLEVLGAFFTGAILARLVSEPSLRRRRDPMAIVLAWQAAWLMALGVAALLGLAARTPAAPAAWFAVWCAGAAMGMQSALNKLPVGLTASTNVMTSNFTQWAISCAAPLLCAPVERGDALRALGRDSVPVLCFALGAAAGALLAARVGLTGIIVPGASVAALAWNRRHRA